MSAVGMDSYMLDVDDGNAVGSPEDLDLLEEPMDDISPAEVGEAASRLLTDVAKATNVITTPNGHTLSFARNAGAAGALDSPTGLVRPASASRGTGTTAFPPATPTGAANLNTSVMSASSAGMQDSRSYEETLAEKLRLVETLKTQNATLDHVLSCLTSNPATASPSIAGMSVEILQTLMDEMVLEVAFDMHRLAAGGHICSTCDFCQASDVYNERGYDIYGAQPPKVSNEMFNCSNCGRPVNASRFAPHLEKCMGKGRNARTRKPVAGGNGNGTEKKTNLESLIGDESDHDSVVESDDGDYGGNKKKKKANAKMRPTSRPRAGGGFEFEPVDKKTGSPFDARSTLTPERKNKSLGRGSALESPIDDDPSSPAKMRGRGPKNVASLAAMSRAEVAKQLQNVCGVMTLTGKACGNTLRCVMHTDEQRAALRASLEARGNKRGREMGVNDDFGEDGEVTEVLSSGLTNGGPFPGDGYGATSPPAKRRKTNGDTSPLFGLGLESDADS